jgi:hypothetical protein
MIQFPVKMALAGRHGVAAVGESVVINDVKICHSGLRRGTTSEAFSLTGSGHEPVARLAINFNEIRVYIPAPSMK